MCCDLIDFLRDAVAERRLRLPLGNLLVPGGELLLDRPLLRSSRSDASSAYLMSLTIGRLRRLVLVDLGRVNVDVDNRAASCRILDLAGHAVVEAHAERQQQIRAVLRSSSSGRRDFCAARIRRSPPSSRRPRRACPASATTADAFPGNAPQPMIVVVTGICVASANLRNSSLAFAGDDAAAARKAPGARISRSGR